jgi:hypothetical protein
MLEDEFRKAKSESIIFNRKRVFLFDTILLPKKSILILRFHKVKSKWRQGVSLVDISGRYTDTLFTVAGQTAPAIQLWQDTSPKKVVIEVIAPNGKINVYNIWDTGNGQSTSQVQGGGMLIDISNNGMKRYYKCNDGHSKPIFEHLEFSIEVQSKMPMENAIH